MFTSSKFTLKENAYLGIAREPFMIITTTNTTPTPKELLQTLRQGFSDRYFYRLAGLDTKQTVIVSRLWLTLAQITIHENEIRVGAPSRIRAFATNMVKLTSGFPMPLGPWREKLQQQLTIFLKRKYN